MTMLCRGSSLTIIGALLSINLSKKEKLQRNLTIQVTACLLLGTESKVKWSPVHICGFHNLRVIMQTQRLKQILFYWKVRHTCGFLLMSLFSNVIVFEAYSLYHVQ